MIAGEKVETYKSRTGSRIMKSPSTKSEIVLMDVEEALDDADLFGDISGAAVDIDGTFLNQLQFIFKNNFKN